MTTYTILPAEPGQMVLTVRFEGGWTMHIRMPSDTPTHTVEAILSDVAQDLTRYYS